MSEPHEALTALQSVVNKALAKKPVERYQQVEEMLHTLRAIKKLLESEPAPATASTSIVVLPFADLSAQKDQEYFCDGLAEEMIDALAKISGWRVVSRTSAFSLAW